MPVASLSDSDSYVTCWRLTRQQVFLSLFILAGYSLARSNQMLTTLEAFSTDHYPAALWHGRPLKINLTAPMAGRVELGGADAIGVTAAV